MKGSKQAKRPNRKKQIPQIRHEKTKTKPRAFERLNYRTFSREAVKKQMGKERKRKGNNKKIGKEVFFANVSVSIATYLP